MADVDVCPKCDGSKRTVGGAVCRTCDGTGVVWRPHPQEAASDPGTSGDPTELRGI